MTASVAPRRADGNREGREVAKGAKKDAKNILFLTIFFASSLLRFFAVAVGAYSAMAVVADRSWELSCE